MLQRTLIQLFESASNKYSDKPYLWEKNDSGYFPKSFKEVRNLVYRTAAGLITLGVKKGDRIALLSEGRIDWIVSELGILYAGAVNVPFSVKINEHEELKFRLTHAECRFCFTSERHVTKIRDLKHDLPDLEKIILFDGNAQDTDEMSFQELKELGKQFLDRNGKKFYRRDA